MSNFLQVVGDATKQIGPITRDDIWNIVCGGLIGAIAWRKHRVLGAFTGATVGAASNPLADGDFRRGLTLLGLAGASVGGARLWKRHPVLGFLGANALFSTVMYLDK